MALESVIFSQKVPQNFQTLGHQIPLLASVDTLSNFFPYNTQTQTIFCHSNHFPLYLTFRPNWDRFPLRLYLSQKWEILVLIYVIMYNVIQDIYGQMEQKQKLQVENSF